MVRVHTTGEDRRQQFVAFDAVVESVDHSVEGIASAGPLIERRIVSHGSKLSLVPFDPITHRRRGPIGGYVSRFGQSREFGERIKPGTALYQIARVTPLGAASQVMTYGWFGGNTFPWVQIGSMIVWKALLTALAVKLFKWR
jgi:hypothetical protein